MKTNKNWKKLKALKIERPWYAPGEATNEKTMHISTGILNKIRIGVEVNIKKI